MRVPISTIGVVSTLQVRSRGRRPIWYFVLLIISGDWEYEFLPTRGAQASGGSPIDTEENASEPETPAPETDTGESDPEGQETEPSPTIKYAPVVSHLDLSACQMPWLPQDSLLRCWFEADFSVSGYRVRKSRDWSPGTVRGFIQYPRSGREANYHGRFSKSTGLSHSTVSAAQNAWTDRHPPVPSVFPPASLAFDDSSLLPQMLGPAPVCK